MKKEEEKAEKRKHSRFAVSGNAYAAYKNGLTKVGKIKDVSLGGLSFEYIDEGYSTRQTGQIDIFTSGKAFYLPRIPVQIVYDISNPYRDGEERPYFSTIDMNRCGIRFGQLNVDQTADLQRFIRSFGKTA